MQGRNRNENIASDSDHINTAKRPFRLRKTDELVDIANSDGCERMRDRDTHMEVDSQTEGRKNGQKRRQRVFFVDLKYRQYLTGIRCLRWIIVPNSIIRAQRRITTRVDDAPTAAAGSTAAAAAAAALYIGKRKRRTEADTDRYIARQCSVRHRNGIP